MDFRCMCMLHNSDSLVNSNEDWSCYYSYIVKLCAYVGRRTQWRGDLSGSKKGKGNKARGEFIDYLQGGRE